LNSSLALAAGDLWPKKGRPVVKGLTLPKDGKNQTCPIGTLKFIKLIQNSILETGLSGVSIVLIKSVYLLTTKCTIICILSADCSIHETGLLAGV